MCTNPLHIQTFAPFQPCVEKEEGTQRVYKRCRRETLTFTADDENDVRCWIKGREIAVRGIWGKPREGWSFETLNQVLNAHKITPRMSANAPDAISSVDLSAKGLGGMQISIKIVRNGKLITFDVSPEDTIENIKAKIQEKEGIPSKQQLLIHDGKKLENQSDLKCYNTKKNIVLYLIICNAPQAAQNVKLFIKTLTKNIITLDAVSDDTIGNIKAKIQEKANIPSEQQKLILKGMIFEDQKTLEFYIKKAFENVDSEKEYVLYLINRRSGKPQKNLQYSLRIFLILITCIFIAIVITARINKVW